MNSANKTSEECESKPCAISELKEIYDEGVFFIESRPVRRNMPLALVIDPKDYPIVREVLERGFNTWPRQQEPEGKLIMRLIEALK